MENIVVYSNGELELKVSFENETIWLTQKQLAELFSTSADNIGLHFKNIFNEKELDENLTTEDFSVVQKEGKREVRRTLKHYNLDAIISVGYRVNSSKATKFRQWATSVLKSYIQNRYTINSEKITNDRFVLLENEVQSLKAKVTEIDTNRCSDKLQTTQGAFFDGEIFDAYVLISNIIRSAKKSIKIFDNYLDESVLTHLSKNEKVEITIYTSYISKQLKLDIQKYNKQYKPIVLKLFKESHDRFIIVDDEDIYHIGASLKDLGKKWFAFSKMDKKIVNILDRIK